MSPHSSQRGSALMWILIMVALFAALSAVVAQMTRGGGDANRELRQVEASEILQYANSFKTAVQGMRIEGIDLNEVSFQNDFVALYTNPACTTMNCRVFNNAGGGMIWMAPQTGWLAGAFSGSARFGQWRFTGNTCVQDFPNTDAADCMSDSIDNEDLVMTLEYLNQDLCLAINKELGIPPVGGEPPSAGECHGEEPFIGAFSEINNNRISGTGINGQQTGCFRQPSACGATGGTAHYVFYRVLAGR